MTRRSPLSYIGPTASADNGLLLTSKRIRTPSAKATPHLIKALSICPPAQPAPPPSAPSPAPSQPAPQRQPEQPPSPSPSCTSTTTSTAKQEPMPSSSKSTTNEPMEVDVSNASSVATPSPSPPSAPGHTPRPYRTPITGFMLFIRKERNTIVNEYKDLPVGELTRIYTQAWDKLEESKKAVFNAQAHKLNVRVGNSPVEGAKENDASKNEHLRLMEIINNVKANTTEPRKAATTPRAPRATPSAAMAKRLESIAQQIGAKMSSQGTAGQGGGGGASSHHRQSLQPPTARNTAGTQAAQGRAPPQMSQAAALEIYYLSLCQPAFPLAGESPLTSAPPAYYLDQYHQLEWQRRAAAESGLKW